MFDALIDLALDGVPRWLRRTFPLLFLGLVVMVLLTLRQGPGHFLLTTWTDWRTRQLQTDLRDLERHLPTLGPVTTTTPTARP